MATKVGEIEVAVIAKLDKLEKDLNTVKKKSLEAEKAAKGGMARVSSAAGAMGKKLLIAGGAMATIAGVRGFANAIKSSIEFADNLGKTASKLGVTTDFLQEMRFAADQSGVSIQTADMALQRFARRAAEAAVGTGEAKDALKQMRIELRDNENQLRSTEALFSDAMEALGKIQDPAERLRLAFKLFDSEGAALVNMAENFKELQIQAQEMGIVLDQSIIKKAEEAKGKIDALAMVTQNELNTALIDLAPLLVDGGRALAWMAKQAGDGYSNIRRWAMIVGLMDMDLSQWTPPEPFERSEVPVKTGATEAALKARKKFLKETKALELKNAGDLVEIAEWERDQKLIAAQKLRESNIIGNLEYFDRVKALTEESNLEITQINKDTAEAAAKALEDATDKMEDHWEGFTDYLGDGFRDAMADMIMTGEISFKALGEAFLREFIQRALSATMDFDISLEQIFGTISKVASGVGNLFNTVDGSAENRLVTDEQILGTVGDWSRSPSVLAPDVGRSKSMRAMETASVSVNIINASGEKAETSETQNADGTRQIEVMIGKSVSADIYRGGPIDSAIRNSYGIKRPGSHGG